MRLQRKNRLESLQEELRQLQSKNEELARRLEEAKASRPQSQRRNEDLARLADLEKKNAEYLDELRRYKDNDPALVEKKSKGGPPSGSRGSGDCC